MASMSGLNVGLSYPEARLARTWQPLGYCRKQARLLNATGKQREQRNGQANNNKKGLTDMLG